MFKQTQMHVGDRSSIITNHKGFEVDYNCVTPQSYYHIRKKKKSKVGRARFIFF